SDLEQDHTLATLAVVEHVRVHVHLGPDAVPPVFTNVAVTAVLGDVGPDRVADVPQALVRVHLSDPLPHGFLTGLHHAQVLLAAFPHRDGDRRVAVPPVEDGTAVDGDDVALVEHAIRGGDPVDLFLAARGIDGLWETVVTLEGRHVPGVPDDLLRHLVQLEIGLSWPHRAP